MRTTPFILAVLAFSGFCLAGKVDKSLWTSLAAGEKKDIMIEFPPVNHKVLQDFSLRGLPLKKRHDQMIKLYQKMTREDQLPVMNHLFTLELAPRTTSLWIDNSISVTGVDFNILEAISKIPGSFKIREVQTVSIFPTYDHKPVDMKAQKSTQYQWGVQKINAPAVHPYCTGDGIVAGVIDTGLCPEHEAFAGSYISSEETWKDVVNSRTEAYDDHGHGSHCAGTLAGRKNGIGVAPGAKIAACKGLDSAGTGTVTALNKCFQWMTCPRNDSGICYGRPKVISCSWGGGTNNPNFTTSIETIKGLGMLAVFAIGNSGPDCGTANSPGDQENAFSVGATDPNNKIAPFSSRGPGGTDRKKNTTIIKPDIVAPGFNITSCQCSDSSTSQYVAYSGTSMATPHVAGAAVLYFCMNPNATPDDVTKALKSEGVPLKADKKCPPSIGTLESPNNYYGSGLVDIKKATGV